MSNLRHILIMLTILAISMMFFLLLQMQMSQEEEGKKLLAQEQSARAAAAAAKLRAEEEKDVGESVVPTHDEFQGPPEVALYFWDRTIDQIGVLFEDEEFLCRWDTKGNLEGYLLINVQSDYGEIFESNPTPIGEKFRPAGSFNPSLPRSKSYGPFQINAWIGNLDRIIQSKRTFLRINYIKKPRFWRTEAEESFFGAWFSNPHLSHQFLVAAKAVGLNKIVARELPTDPSDKFIAEIRRQSLLNIKGLPAMANESDTLFLNGKYFPDFGGIMDREFQEGEFLDYSITLARTVVNARVQGKKSILVPLDHLLLSDPELITGVRPLPSADSEGLILHPSACALSTATWFLEEKEYRHTLSVGGGYVIHFFSSSYETAAILLPPDTATPTSTLEITAPVPQTRYYDLYGNPLSNKDSISRNITYFWSSLPLEELENKLVGNLKSKPSS